MGPGSGESIRADVPASMVSRESRSTPDGALPFAMSLPLRNRHARPSTGCGSESDPTHGTVIEAKSGRLADQAAIVPPPGTAVKVDPSNRNVVGPPPN